MKYLRVTSRPDPAAAPPAFRLIADSTHVEEARLLGWNAVDSRGVTLLFVVDGEADTVRTALTDDPGFAAVDVTPVDANRFYLLVTVDPDAMALFAPVFETLTRDGLVVVKPVVYREGGVHVRLVGETDTVGAAVEALPDAVDVTVHEVGEGGVEPASAAAALSDRQRETLLTAIEMGYYDTPRQVTHETIADRLDRSPSTVSEHLQKAEAKLVSNAMAATAPEDVFGRER